jgi:hypothetical protein
MESRTRWRKGEPGLREGVAALVEALRDGVGADALALFDDDRADPDPAAAGAALSFWDAFAELPCLQVDWAQTYGELRRAKHFERACTCGRHRVSGFLIHERWALLLVTPLALGPGAAPALSSGLRALADRLPPAKAPDPVAERYRQPPPRPATGAPLWWVRRPRQ